jgi:beta-lactamase superfamily II metal-dependent hydrolase
LGIASLLCVVLGALLTAGRHEPRLRVLLPEIAGDSALIITPDGRSLLIDGGTDGAALATWLGNTLPFGQRRLDAVVLTRTDAKTVPGQLAALKRYRVATALLGTTDRRSSHLDAWWDLLEIQQVTAQHVAAGDQLKLGQCTLKVLTEVAGQLTLALHCGATAAYFLQAIDDDAEDRLASQDLAPAALVVYPWKRAADTPLLRRLSPAAIVFSEGGRAEEVQRWTERQIGTARLYHEAIHGQITLASDEQQTTMTTERGE